MKLSVSLLFIFITSLYAHAQKGKYVISSPDKRLAVTVNAKDHISVILSYDKKVVMTIDTVQLQLSTGEKLGKRATLAFGKIADHNKTVTPIHYKKKIISDQYQELVLSFRQQFSLIFRAYDDGFAYRFKTDRKDSLIISREDVGFTFQPEDKAYVPYVNSPRNKDIFVTSFENTYTVDNLTAFKKDTLAFMPVLIDTKEHIKVAITEADLEEYPGMFLQSTGVGFRSVHAPYPLQEHKAGSRNTQTIIDKRAPYIARTSGMRYFPWRAFIVSDNDKKLLNNDMVYRLASPSRLDEVSWVKPGKVAWDWWNNWNLSGVDFKAGVNTKTYKYFIDFAAANKIEYILLDEGWAENNDLFKIIPEIDLKEIIRYANEKHVGVWIWAGWVGLNEHMEKAVSHYAAMGVAGFKVDFMDRDDQKMVQFYYRLAQTAANHKLMLDLHGAYKPTGIQRTYPNILNFEGVHGLENVKWSNPDFPKYDCTVPFIRMLAGPMDYTPGAMLNATKENFRAIYAEPMSQGTRCHQLALYVLYESPFAMLSDSPTHYEREQECTSFIASVPTTFDETRVLTAAIGDYVAIARRKNNQWYIGAITNWEARTIHLDLSFLPKGIYTLDIFEDGVNANRNASDYRHHTVKINSEEGIDINLSKGGGWAAVIR